MSRAQTGLISFSGFFASVRSAFIQRRGFMCLSPQIRSNARVLSGLGCRMAGFGAVFGPGGNFSRLCDESGIGHGSASRPLFSGVSGARAVPQGGAVVGPDCAAITLADRETIGQALPQLSVRDESPKSAGRSRPRPGAASGGRNRSAWHRHRCNAASIPPCRRPHRAAASGRSPAGRTGTCRPPR
jgi:hypothetical protein